jgi:hypothetical protein
VESVIIEPVQESGGARVSVMCRPSARNVLSAKQEGSFGPCNAFLRAFVLGSHIALRWVSIPMMATGRSSG